MFPPYSVRSSKIPSLILFTNLVDNLSCVLSRSNPYCTFSCSFSFRVSMNFSKYPPYVLIFLSVSMLQNNQCCSTMQQFVEIIVLSFEYINVVEVKLV